MSLEKRFDESENSFEETDPLTEDEFNRISRSAHQKGDRSKWIMGALALLVLVQTTALVTLARRSSDDDPSLGLWCEYSLFKRKELW